MMRRHVRIPLRASILSVALALAGTALAGATASAAPVWRIDSLANTTAAPDGQQSYSVQITNVGDASAPTGPGGDADNCTPGAPSPSDPTKCYTVRATFPPGLTPVGATTEAAGASCTTDAGTNSVTCSVAGDTPDEAVPARSSNPFRVLTFVAGVDHDAAGVLTTSFTVAGGEAAAATTVDPTRISNTPPPFGIDAFDAQVTADASGAPLSQAGGTPYTATTLIDFNTIDNPDPVLPAAIFGPEHLWPAEPTRDVIADLPPGFVGNPTTVDTCTMGDLANGGGLEALPLCPATSQVGTVVVRINGLGSHPLIGPLALYNLVPPPDVPARFGFNVIGTIVTMDVGVRSGSDYGVTARVSNVSEGLAIAGTTVTLWGVPADPSHDAERACPGQIPLVEGGLACPLTGAPKRALLRNPTSCTAPGVGLPTTVHIDSWTHPGVFDERTIESHDPAGYPAAPGDWGPNHGTDGCDRVPFDPVLRGGPTAGAQAGKPAAFTFDLTLPQDDTPKVNGAAAQSDLKKAVVTLPAGVHVNPSSAGGLGACSSAQIALSSDGPASCPDSSKIGDVTVDTPLLDVPVTGGVYLAKPFDNPFGSLVAVYIVASAKGVVLKLPGQVAMDPSTGQITTTFDNNPQLPFSRLHLEFKGGPRAPLTLPNRCGTFITHAHLTGWNGREVDSDSTFTVNENAAGAACPSTFTPGFQAGTKANSAGLSSSFRLRFTRDDEDQQFRAVTVHLPGGLTGKIASVDLCGDVQAKAGTCSAGSKIGDVTVGAGSGTNPFFITNGRAYLTGPYKGAPYGVDIVVPAVAGPFDLGNVNVRSALFVDKHDATVRIVSDPLPTILQGIPLDVRDVRVDVNKPGFFLNPTSCAVKTITGSLTSAENASANVSDRFQAADCGSLGFKPRMVLRVGGRGHTRRGQTSPLSTTLTMPRRNQANLRFVRVTLPSTINARLNTIQDACTRTEFENDVKKCEHAKAGTAVASTPLLRAPLRGNVYFVKNGHAIPDLFVALRGQVAFDLIGRISIVNNTLLRTTFATAPDVPIRSFTLRLLGGPSTASIGAVRNLCSPSARRAKAAVDYIAQNGRVLQLKQALRVAGCHTGGRHRRR